LFIELPQHIHPSNNPAFPNPIGSTKERESQREREKMTEAMVRNKPGMASVKDMPLLQDGPPPGGFPPVRYARRIPNSGPSAMAIFLTAFGAFAWGMYEVGKGNKIRRYCYLCLSPIVISD